MNRLNYIIFKVCDVISELIIKFVMWCDKIDEDIDEYYHLKLQKKERKNE